jgi:hypothetical protein
MCVNHLRHQFSSLIAPASVSACGVDAAMAMAGTRAARAEANGASASPALVGNGCPSGTGERGPVDGTWAAVDPDRSSQALRSLSTTSKPRGCVSPASGRAAGRSATPGEQLGQVATPAARGGAASPTESRGICAATAKPAAMVPYSTPLFATRVVATTSTATSQVATGSVATDPVATRSRERSSDPGSSVMLVARFSPEHATCRSTLVAS